MRMKFILIMICCSIGVFGLASCGNKDSCDEISNVHIEGSSLETEKATNFEEEDINPAEKTLKESYLASEIYDLSYVYFESKNMNIYDYYMELKGFSNKNPYATLFADNFEKLNYGSYTDLEKDYLEYYLRSRYITDGYNELTVPIGAWVAGYDANGNILVRDNGDPVRLIVVDSGITTNKYRYGYYQVSEGFRYYPSLYSEDNQHTDYFVNHCTTPEILLRYTGVDVEINEGIIFEDEKIERCGDICIIGMEYHAVSPDLFGDILEDCKTIQELMDDYYANGYSVIEEEKRLAKLAEKNAKEAEKNAEPKIGMTKIEVLNGKWGQPDKKNIDEYAWGIHEQWVYNSKGYIYFEDGIVTSISRR